MVLSHTGAHWVLSIFAVFTHKAWLIHQHPFPLGLADVPLRNTYHNHSVLEISVIKTFYTQPLPADFSWYYRGNQISFNLVDWIKVGTEGTMDAAFIHSAAVDYSYPLTQNL